MADEQHSGNPAPGWYADPNGEGQRYWDGNQWTEHTQAAATPEPPSTAPPPAPPAPPGGLESAGAPVPPAPQAGPGHPATAGIRLGARIIDGLIIAVPFWIILAIAGVGVADSPGESFLFGLLGTAIYLGYFVYLESSRGQTPGKQVLNLRTAGPDGGHPTQEQAFRRNAWVLVGIVPFLGGFASLAIAIWIAVTISNDPARRGVHDKWAGGTAVLRTG